MSSVLIDGGCVVTVDDEFTIHDPGWVFVDGNRIAGVGPGAAPDGVRGIASRTIEAAGCAVMPGMTNAHTHLFQTLFRGLGDDKPLLDWLRDCIWPGAVHLTGESARLAALVGLAENLRGGATSVLDHQYIHVDESIDEAVCQAADDIGVRFLLARGWADRNYEPRLMETAATILERTQRIRDRWHHPEGRIAVETGPLIPWGCSDNAMRTIVGDARSWGAGMHIHCAETAVEVDMSIEERGMRHVEWLHSLGVLGPDAQLAHSVWLDDTELDLIASHNALVVHCPVSNMYLASGVPRVEEMKERGIRIALGSDGPGSNNRQDMFEVLKSTVLLQKVSNLNAVGLSPEDAIIMACRGGAMALGRSDLGYLAAGNLADLLVVSLDSVFIGPVHRVPSALVFCASPADVTHVMVDGRVLIDDGVFVGVDESALVAEAGVVGGRLFGRAGFTTRLAAGDV